MADSKIKLAVQVLESFRGRDKIMRTVQFASIMSSGLLSGVTPESAVKLKTVASQLGLCRLILRLFDDLPMLAFNLFGGGLGQKEQDPIVKILTFFKGLIDQCFFPIEHIAWAAENKIINVTSAKWWMLSVACWGTSLCLDILRCVRQFLRRKSRMAVVRKNIQTERTLSSDGHDIDSTELKTLDEEQNKTMRQVVMDLCNLGCAIHWFIPGFLWAQKLPPSVVGLLGTISSVLGFHAFLQQQRQKAK